MWAEKKERKLTYHLLSWANQTQLGEDYLMHSQSKNIWMARNKENPFSLLLPFSPGSTSVPLSQLLYLLPLSTAGRWAMGELWSGRNSFSLSSLLHHTYSLLLHGSFPWYAVSLRKYLPAPVLCPPHAAV